MKRIMKRIIGIALAMVCLVGAFPAINAEAAINYIEGGHESKATAYMWGSYSNMKSTPTIILPAGEDEFWVSFMVPSNSRTFIKCSYSAEYAGMGFGTENANASVTNASSPVINPNSLIPFVAADVNNPSNTTQTFFAFVRRPIGFTGEMRFTLTMYDRVKKGRGTFNFSGTATNPGNTSINLAGVNSSILSLNLSNSTLIPPGAIVKSLETTGTQSPNQGNVHHMIAPTRPTNTWITSRVSSATSGTYGITLTNGFLAQQTWQFRYNAMANKRSTMSNVKLILEWEYDVNQTNYGTF